MLEDQRPEALAAAGTVAARAVEDAVAVEVDDVIGLTVLLGPVQLRAQGRESGRVEDGQLRQLAQRRQSLDQGPGAHAMVDVGNPVLLRPRADQEDPQGRGGLHLVLLDLVGQPPPHAGAPAAGEQEARAVVDQLPGQGEQGRGGRAGLLLLIVGGLGQHVVVDQHREPPLGAAAGTFRQPSYAFRPSCFSPSTASKSFCPQILEALLDRAGAVRDHLAHRPLRVALDVPGQLIGLDAAQGRREPERPAADLGRAGLRPGRRRGPPARRPGSRLAGFQRPRGR